MKPKTDKIHLVTEEMLDNRLKEMEIKIDQKFEQFGQYMQGLFIDLKSEFFNKIDPFLTEIERAREDREIATYKTEKNQNKLQNHEERLTRLENK